MSANRPFTFAQCDSCRKDFPLCEMLTHHQVSDPAVLVPSKWFCPACYLELIEEIRRKDATYLAAHPILAPLLKAWWRFKWLFWRPL